jgi:hypothetical protein
VIALRIETSRLSVDGAWKRDAATAVVTKWVEPFADLESEVHLDHRGERLDLQVHAADPALDAGDLLRSETVFQIERWA